MMEVFRFIRSITTKWQRCGLYITIISPLILSGLLYLVSNQIGITLFDIRTKEYLIVMWVLSSIFFLFLFLTFSFHCTHHRDYCENRTKISNSIKNLLDNRLKERSDFIPILCFLLFVFYYLTLIPLIIEYTNDDIFLSIYMIIPVLFLFLLFFSLLRRIFIGFREKAVYRFSGIFFLFIVWVLFYWLNLNDKLQITLVQSSELSPSLQENAHWIIPLIISTILALVILKAEGEIKKNYPKRKIKRWERSLDLFDIFSELILAFIFFSFILLLNLFLGVISIDNPELQKLMLIIIAFFISAIFLMGFFFIKNFSNSFIEDMISWNEFFECYHGQTIEDLGEHPQQLIKVSGKCRAISINEKYRKKHENFNQHFFLEIDGSREDIDVISLDEKTPFTKFVPLVSENDEIILVGEIKSILDDETLFPSDNRISELILAYHIEKKHRDR